MQPGFEKAYETTANPMYLLLLTQGSKPRHMDNVNDQEWYKADECRMIHIGWQVSGPISCSQQSQGCSAVFVQLGLQSLHGRRPHHLSEQPVYVLHCLHSKLFFPSIQLTSGLHQEKHGQ